MNNVSKGRIVIEWRFDDIGIAWYFRDLNGRMHIAGHESYAHKLRDAGYDVILERVKDKRALRTYIDETVPFEPPSDELKRRH